MPPLLATETLLTWATSLAVPWTLLMLHPQCPQSPAVLPCLAARGSLGEYSPSRQRQSTEPGHTGTHVSCSRLPRQGREGKQFVCREADFICSVAQGCQVVLPPSGHQAFYREIKGGISSISAESCDGSQTTLMPWVQRQQVSHVHTAEVPPRGGCLQGLAGWKSRPCSSQMPFHGMTDSASSLTPACVVSWWSSTAVDDIASLWEPSVPFWTEPSALHSLSLHREAAVVSVTSRCPWQATLGGLHPPSLHLVTLPI